MSGGNCSRPRCGQEKVSRRQSEAQGASTNPSVYRGLHKKRNAAMPRAVVLETASEWGN